MKAILPATRHENGKMLDGEKEQTAYFAVVAYKANSKNYGPKESRNFDRIITVRCWMGRSRSASTVYASVWVHAAGVCLGGHGQAGGYGYCKKSAAIGSAIRSAGITLDKSIAGVGESAVREALRAIAHALGFRQFCIVEG